MSTTTTYNAKTVNRVDRVITVLAIVASAVMLFAGINANQQADASVPATQFGMVPAHSGSVSSGAGGALDVTTTAVERVSITSSGGTLNPEG